MKIRDVKGKVKEGRERLPDIDREHQKKVKEGFWSGGKYHTMGTAYYLIVPRTDGRLDMSQWSVMSYEDTPGSNPLHLSKMLDKHSESLGWDGWDVQASWNGDIDQEIARLEKQRDDYADKKDSFPTQYYDGLNGAKKLHQAKEIMQTADEAKPDKVEEASSPMGVINKFLDKKKSKERRSADLAKNPHKVGQLKSDEVEFQRDLEAVRNGEADASEMAEKWGPRGGAFLNFIKTDTVDENIKGWKNAANDIAKHRAKKGKNVKLVRLKKDGSEWIFDPITKKTTVKEAMPNMGKKVIIAYKGKKVGEFAVQPNARVHHFDQELRKLSGRIDMSDFERTQVARDLAAGKTVKLPSGYAMQQQDTRPREMESVQEDGRETASAAVKRSEKARQRNINKAKSMMKRGFDAETAAKEHGVRAKDLEESTGSFKVGDVVIPNRGPHKGQKHEVIHCFDDGSCNVKPIGLSPNRIRYGMGAAKAQPEDLQLAEASWPTQADNTPDHTPTNSPTVSTSSHNDRVFRIADLRLEYKKLTGKSAPRDPSLDVEDYEKMVADAREALGENGKGLYHNVNKRKKTGTSRPKSHPKAPTDKAWKDAAKTAKESTEITLEDTQDFHEEFGYLGYSLDENDLFEADYQGRKVKLNKPMAGDVKKFKVYVKDPKTGNVKKVNFGQKGVKIKKNNPERRKSFRARHNCDNPGPKTKARYWSCRKW